MDRRRSVWVLGVTIAMAVFAMSSVNASAAVVTDDFSTQSPYWSMVEVVPETVTADISGGEMSVDFGYNPVLGNWGGVGGGVYGNPSFVPETTEVSSKLEIDGNSIYLYAGVIGRASADLGYTPTGEITGHAYSLTISGYEGSNYQGDFQINRLADGDQEMLAIVKLTEYKDIIENNPLYMKMTVETIQGGDVEIKGKISLYSDFSDPFAQVEVVDSDPSKIGVPGLVGLLAFNDVGEDPQAVTVSFDDFYAADFIDTTVPGDCNGDGYVNSTDLDVVRAHWGQSVSGAVNGDLSGDGVVNSSDLDLVRGNWGATPGAAVVPEPASFVLLVLAGLIACGRRR